MALNRVNLENFFPGIVFTVETENSEYRIKCDKKEYCWIKGTHRFPDWTRVKVVGGCGLALRPWTVEGNTICVGHRMIIDRFDNMNNLYTSRVEYISKG